MPDLKDLFSVANTTLDMKGMPFEDFIDNLRSGEKRELLYKKLTEGGVDLKDYTTFENNIFSNRDFYKDESSWEAFKYGWQHGAAVIPFDRPTATPPSEESGTQRFLSSAGQALGDLPAMIPTVAAMGLAPEAGIPAVMATGGAALAVPSMIRKYAMDVYEKGAPKDISDYANRVLEEVKAGAHGFITGATATAPGAAVSRGLTALGARQIAKTGASIFAKNAGLKAAASATTKGVEVATDITSGAIIQAAREGRIPDYKDFLDNAAPFIAIHGAKEAPTLLRRIYKDYGIKPSVVAKTIPNANLNDALSELDGLMKEEVVSKEPRKTVFDRSEKVKGQAPIEGALRRDIPQEQVIKSQYGAMLLKAQYKELVEADRMMRATQPGMSPDVIMDYDAWWKATVSKGEVVDILPPTSAGTMGGKPLGPRILKTPGPKKAIAELPEVSKTSVDQFWGGMHENAPIPWKDLRGDNTIVTFKPRPPKPPSDPMSAVSEEPVGPREPIIPANKERIRFSLEVADDIDDKSLSRIRKAFAIIEDRYPKLVRLMDEPSKIPGVHPKVEGGPLNFLLQHKASIESSTPYGAYERSVEYDVPAGSLKVPFPGEEPIKTLVTEFREGLYLGYNKLYPISHYVETIKHELVHLAYSTLSPEKFLNRSTAPRSLIKKFGSTYNAKEMVVKRSGAIVRKTMSRIMAEEGRKAGMSKRDIQSFLDSANDSPHGMRDARSIKDFYGSFYDLLDGIYETLGGDQVGITPQAFSPEAWNKVKVSFDKLHKEIGGSFDEFSKEVIRQLGDRAIPYLAEYKKEFIPDAKKVLNPEIDAATKAWIEIYGPKQHDIKMGQIRSIFSFPEQAMKGNAWQSRHSAALIEGQQLIEWHNAKDMDYIEGLEHELPGRFNPSLRKQASEMVRPAAEQLFDLLKTNKAEAQRLIDTNPVYADAAKVIDWFMTKKKAIIKYKQDLFEIMVPREMKPAFKEALASNKSEAMIKKLAKDYDVSESSLLEHVKEYNKINMWGIKDFLTNIERGMWRVIDKDGQVRAVRQTRKEARQAMSELQSEGVKFGENPISPEFHEPINPLSQRKGILKGEKNIFDAMRTYAYIVNKKMVLDPIAAQMDKDFKADQGHLLYPKEARAILAKQRDWVSGYYEGADKVFDDLAKSFGGKPRIWTRSWRQTGSVMAKAKMGYKMVGGIINYSFGKLHTKWDVGLDYMRQATDWIKTPEGKAFIANNEPYLGMSFAGSEAGKLKAGDTFLHPLYFWEIGEAKLRPQSLAANYLYAKQKGMSEMAATLYARKQLRFEQVVYNAANLPQVLRYAAAKHGVLQFKTYFANEVRYLSSLPGAKKMEMLATMGLLTGPAGLLAIVKSIPLLGSAGFFQDAEEWLAKNLEISKNINPAYGLPGLFGANISGMATPQFFTSDPADSFGPFISTMVDVWKGLIGPVISGEDKVWESIHPAEVAMSLVPVFHYWRDMINYSASKDGWVRDSAGIPKYQLPGLKAWNIAMMAIGVPSVEKTKQQVLLRELRRNDELARKNANRLGKLIVEKINKEENIPTDWVRDAAMLGMDLPNLLENAQRMKELPPEQRAMMRDSLIEKWRAMKVYQ